MERKRHRFYRHLLVICLWVMVSFALPGRWARLANPGYMALILLLVTGLGGATPGRRDGDPRDRLFRGLGFACLIAQALWLFTPREMRVTGFPLLLAYTSFILWGVVRLVSCLSQERRVSSRVVAGALAGYLMLGISGGLILSVLETLAPGSFHLAHDPQSLILPPEDPAQASMPVWTINFIRLNYFAFVSLTTVGYGDITPATPTAQMMSIGLSVAGPLYIAVVMGLLISRFTIQQETDQGSEGSGGEAG